MSERKLTPETTKRLHAFFVAQYEAYKDSVLKGTRVAGRLERLMVERQEQELTNHAFEWRFDARKATAPLIWMAANLVFPSGEKKGRPLKLEGWQVWLTMVLFGWINSKGNRRYTDAYIEIPRKNGKSTYAAAVLCYLALAKAESNGNPCYVTATSLEQAGECFGNAIAELAKADVKAFNSKNNKIIQNKYGKIVAISAEPKDGKLPHGAVFDEYHQYKSNDLIDSIMSGSMADPNVLAMRITTAGTLLNGVCKQEHDKCVKVLEGSIPMDRYFVSIYTIDEGDSPDDPSCWEKANPNYGISFTQEDFLGRYNYYKPSAAGMVTFKTKNLNMWVNSLKRWANMDIWNSQCCFPWNEAELEHKSCYGGLDLSHNSDFTAFVLDFPMDNGTHRHIYRYFIPEARIVELERTLNVPVMQWVEDGYITATPGPIIDYAYVAMAIMEANAKYDLHYVACDRHRIEILNQHMPDWWASIGFEFSQSMKQMAPSTSEYERAYLTGNIQSNGNPVQKWMMACCDTKTDANGNKKLVKPDYGRSANRIDGVIAAIMAYDTAITQEGLGLVGDVSEMVDIF